MIEGCWSFVFFFQAEDGIRDRDVTGVQTCALPIWPAQWLHRDRLCPASGRRPPATRRPPGGRVGQLEHTRQRRDGGPDRSAGLRSEERRVGKEWGSGRVAE